MRWAKVRHWFEGCRGPRVKVRSRFVTRAERPDELGRSTVPIHQCRKCGRIFQGKAIPGEWTLEELTALEEARK